MTAVWIPFRAPNLGNLLTLVGQLFSGGITNAIPLGMVAAIGLMICALAAQFMGEFGDFKRRFLAAPVPLKAMSYAACTAVILIVNSGGPKTFIYFQF